MTTQRRARAKAPALARVPQSREEVARFIARVGALEARLAALKAVADEAVRAAGEALEREAAQPQAELAELRAGVQSWCEAHRAALTRDGRIKTVEFGTGRVMWRLRPPKVAIRGTEAVIAACRSLGMTRFLREKVEINREAMLAEPEAAGAIAGVTIASAGEDFVIEPAELVAPQAATGAPKPLPNAGAT
jgi:phage host-nuclease inhibitor protein Gam